MSFYLTPPKTTTNLRQLHGVLSNYDIEELLRYVSQQSLEEAKLGGGKVNEDIRRSKIVFLPTNSDTKWVYNKLAVLIAQINQESFNFHLTALQHIQYTEYHAEKQGNYDDHLDWVPNTILPRKLSLCIQLTDGAAYEGGDLLIKTSSKSIPASRTKGDALIFPSFLLHGVTPVTRGIRKSLVVWVEGPEWT